MSPTRDVAADPSGYTFRQPELFELALRHRSWCAENGAVESNERLEFLGDSVLGLVITDYLFTHHPGTPEGTLAAWRAELVNTTTLARVGERVGFGTVVRLGRGEEATGGRTKPSILADVTEAVLGAIFLDAGLDAVRKEVLLLWADEIADVALGIRWSDHKSRLQELAARRQFDPPHYRVDGSGPDHDRRFTATVSLGGSARGSGLGRTKKEAEQAAAREAIAALGGAESVPSGDDAQPHDPTADASSDESDTH